MKVGIQDSWKIFSNVSLLGASGFEHPLKIPYNIRIISLSWTSRPHSWPRPPRYVPFVQRFGLHIFHLLLQRKALQPLLPASQGPPPHPQGAHDCHSHQRFTVPVVPRPRRCGAFPRTGRGCLPAPVPEISPGMTRQGGSRCCPETAVDATLACLATRSPEGPGVSLPERLEHQPSVWFILQFAVWFSCCKFV